METAETEITLALLPLGGRLLVRSKKDWRVAVVSRIDAGTITISVSSPRGGSYRLRRAPETTIGFDGRVPFLHSEELDTWRDNLTAYDLRW